MSEEQQDAFKEIGNIGAGHASTALSEMINKRVTMVVPRAYVVPIRRVPEVVGGYEVPIVGIYLNVSGDIPGKILIALPAETARYLVRELLGEEPTPEFSAPLEQSALEELGNIISGSYLSALGEFLNRRFVPSTPSMAYDMAGAVVDLIVIELGERVNYAVTIETRFVIASCSLSAQFFFLLDEESYRKVLEVIGMYLK
ncbi:MAG: chemotaxis protein CheC [Euryarchaeota archaeon]|nr:chemotaxis protein CheC [Euryarchaeota archaeon]